MKKASNGPRPLLRLQVFIAAITLAAVAVTILLDRQTYVETKEMATEQFNRQQLILARSAASGIETYYGELIAELSSLVKLPDLQQISPPALQYMQHVYWGFPPRTSIRLLDSNGVLRLIYPFEGWRGELIGRDYSYEAFFQEARETGRVSVSELIINEQGEPRIRVAVPIYLTHKTETVSIGDETGIIVTPIDPDKPEADSFQGVLVGSLDPLIIAQDFISPIVSGQTGYAWLLNENGIFLAHNEEGFTGQNAFEVRAEKNPEISRQAIEQIQRRMMAGEEGVDRYVSGWYRGQMVEIEKLVAFTPVHINGHTWSVAVCAPVNEVEEIVHTAHRSELYTLAFVILALTAGGLALFTTSYRWSHSLEREVARQTRELRETTDYLNNLIRYANAPIVVWNPDKRVTIFNKAFEKMSGRSETEMIGRPLDVLFPKESRSDSLNKIESASRGEYWETVEIPILGRDGGIRLGLWNSANIYGESGKTLIATIAQGQDITERKRAEKERARLLTQIQKQARLMQQIMDTVPEGVLLLDADMRVRLASLPAREYLAVLVGAGEGAALPRLGERSIEELLTPPPEGLSHEVEIEGPPRRAFEIAAQPMKDGPGDKGWVLVIRDVTEERQVRQHIQLQDRLAAVGQLAAGIAHDFNNILAVIVLYTHMVLRTPDLHLKNRERLETIIQQSQRATDLIRQILDFGRRAVLERQPLDLAPLLKEVTTLLKRTLSENIEIELVYGSALNGASPESRMVEGLDEYTVNADPTRVQQALMNLALNARDAMPEGGILRIGLERIQTPPTQAGTEGEEWVKLTVMDTGTGIPPDIMPHIFEPFFTTKEVGQGAGLGLAQVYGIVAQHEGHIDVTTKVGEGTTFTLYLPALPLPQTEKTVEKDLPPP